jgi:hypothetical protein
VCAWRVLEIGAGETLRVFHTEINLVRPLRVRKAPPVGQDDTQQENEAQRFHVVGVCESYKIPTEKKPAHDQAESGKGPHGRSLPAGKTEAGESGAADQVEGRQYPHTMLNPGNWREEQYED